MKLNSMTKFHLPSLPGKFEQAALALPAQIDAILATFDDNEDASGVVDVIDYVEAREHVARRIKADTPVVNALVHCRLKSIALWAKLTPRRAPPGKKIGSGGEPIFAKATTAKYRKVGDNAERLNEYAVAAAAEDVEMSPTAFLKWLKGDSGEKLAEKKAEIEAEIEAAIKHTPTATQADAIEWLEAADDFDLLLTDPPYSTDVDDINAFAESWLPLALSKMKPTGRAFVLARTLRSCSLISALQCQCKCWCGRTATRWGRHQRTSTNSTGRPFCTTKGRRRGRWIVP